MNNNFFFLNKKKVRLLDVQEHSHALFGRALPAAGVAGVTGFAGDAGVAGGAGGEAFFFGRPLPALNATSPATAPATPATAPATPATAPATPATAPATAPATSAIAPGPALPAPPAPSLYCRRLLELFTRTLAGAGQAAN